METQEKTLDELLTEGEGRFPEIVALYNWSMNYEAGKTPFTLFIDLIGYTDRYGTALYDLNENNLGYLELGYLADALKEYAAIGQDAYQFVSNLMDAEVANV